MALRYLFIDFDSFYASVEQESDPHLRGQPIAIVPSINVETTSCIAASYEAKHYGVKTGVPVRQARVLCPKIKFVQANHEKYVAIHNSITKIIHEIIFVDEVLSIDEMYGRLPPKWQSPKIAIEKAEAIKASLKKAIGPCITASIGIAPNRFIAKLASKMKKPNGLVLIDHPQLPQALDSLDLSDITGIGARMLIRLKNQGILDVASLCQADRSTLHRIWGSIEGDRFWYALRGIALAEQSTSKRSFGHSHVLPPKLRTFHGAFSTLHRMLEKACHRLRMNNYFTGHLILQVKFGFEWRWGQEVRCSPTQDTLTLARLMNMLWETRPSMAPNPTKVSVTLMGLIHAQNHTPSLFETSEEQQRAKLLQTIDQIKQRYGSRSIYYGTAMIAQKTAEAAPMRIAFNHIPDLSIERD
tara:strand:+ start:61 stop:1299 length:1239 start_codon:yes stop_codon:yes gene_type:complete